MGQFGKCRATDFYLRASVCPRFCPLQLWPADPSPSWKAYRLGLLPRAQRILCTEELRRRPSRLPDYEKEKRALVALLGALLGSHSNILQTLADTILDVIQCDSSGVSLLTKEDGGKRFYWFFCSFRVKFMRLTKQQAQ